MFLPFPRPAGAAGLPEVRKNLAMIDAPYWRTTSSVHNTSSCIAKTLRRGPPTTLTIMPRPHVQKILPTLLENPGVLDQVRELEQANVRSPEIDLFQRGRSSVLVRLRYAWEF